MRRQTGRPETRIREYMLMDLDEGAFGISFGIEYDPGLTLDEILYGMALNYDEHLLVAAHYRYGGPAGGR